MLNLLSRAVRHGQFRLLLEVEAHGHDCVAIWLFGSGGHVFSPFVSMESADGRTVSPARRRSSAAPVVSCGRGVLPDLGPGAVYGLRRGARDWPISLHLYSRDPCPPLGVGHSTFVGGGVLLAD